MNGARQENLFSLPAAQGLYVARQQAIEAKLRHTGCEGLHVAPGKLLEKGAVGIAPGQQDVPDQQRQGEFIRLRQVGKTRGQLSPGI